jgi:hypothetical protein
MQSFQLLRMSRTVQPYASVAQWALEEQRPSQWLDVDVDDLLNRSQPVPGSGSYESLLRLRRIFTRPGRRS